VTSVKLKRNVAYVNWVGVNNLSISFYKFLDPYTNEFAIFAVF